MFAFASGLSGRFQLRCGDPGLPEIVRNLPNTWRGTYFSDRVKDFACDRVQIELSEPVAVEAGGELLGRERVVELKLAAPVRFASLRV